MTRREQIIAELEKVHGVELDANFDPYPADLCDGESCRHSECECWDNFRFMVDEYLKGEKQLADIQLAQLPCQHKDTRGGECLSCGKSVVTRSVLAHYQELERHYRTAVEVF